MAVDVSAYLVDTRRSCSLQSTIPDAALKEECCMGIDEAGRGPVLGKWMTDHNFSGIVCWTEQMVPSLVILTHYPARACAAGVKHCLRVCVYVCVCLCKKNIEKCFKQGRKGVYRRHSQWNHTRMFLYLIQVQAVLYVVISATSYYRFCGSTPFEIARDSYGQQHNSYSHTRKYRRNWSGNVQRGTRGKYSMNTL